MMVLEAKDRRASGAQFAAALPIGHTCVRRAALAGNHVASAGGVHAATPVAPAKERQPGFHFAIGARPARTMFGYGYCCDHLYLIYAKQTVWQYPHGGSSISMDFNATMKISPSAMTGPRLPQG
jgi:hypothetical protein